MSKKAFVIGHPIEHTRLPIIHGYWIDRYAIDASFEAIDVWPDSVATFLKRIRSGEFVGGNVTKPHKESILPFCDTLTSVARATGSVNKLSLADGVIVGDNTDDVAFLRTIGYRLGDDRYRGKTAVVIGAGAAARSVVFALQRVGLAKIYVLNRTLAKASDMAGTYSNVEAGELGDLGEVSRFADLIVNTIDAAVNGSRLMTMDFVDAKSGTLIIDLAYNPFMTDFLLDADRLGHQIVDGLSMLMQQAASNFLDWFGVEPAVDEEFIAYVRALDYRALQRTLPQFREADECPICNASNGHSLSCPTLGVVKPIELTANHHSIRLIDR